MAYRVAKRSQGKPLKPKPTTNKLPTLRPAKETAKPQVTISTSNILRRKPMKEVYGTKNSRRHILPEPHQDLFLDYQDQVEASCSELLRSSHAALHQSHTDLTNSLENLRMRDTTFYENLKKQGNQLLAPLLEETIETCFTRDGKSVTERAKVSQRIETFKASLAKKVTELGQCWAEWEEVQSQIVELGVEVLGAEAFEGGSALDPRGKNGYRRDMEELGLEHQIWLEGVDEEIQLIGRDALNKMMATEKEANTALKKEQASLIVRMFAEND